jgi:hypothetical protein
MMDEFSRKVLKLNEPRLHKIRNSLGVYDAYKYIRKNKWFSIGQKLTEHQFYSIIRGVNNLLVDSLLQGNDIVLPCRMGMLELRKFLPKYTLKDGKVKITLPIDWHRTLKLWSEDEEAYKERTLVKMEEKEIFQVYYNRAKADYGNKSFYEFKVNRDLKRRLAQRIKLGNMDAYII